MGADKKKTEWGGNTGANLDGGPLIKGLTRSRTNKILPTGTRKEDFPQRGKAKEVTKGVALEWRGERT